MFLNCFILLLCCTVVIDVAAQAHESQTSQIKGEQLGEEENIFHLTNQRVRRQLRGLPPIPPGIQPYPGGLRTPTTTAESQITAAPEPVNEDTRHRLKRQAIPVPALFPVDTGPEKSAESDIDNGQDDSLWNPANPQPDEGRRIRHRRQLAPVQPAPNPDGPSYPYAGTGNIQQNQPPSQRSQSRPERQGPPSYLGFQESESVSTTEAPQERSVRQVGISTPNPSDIPTEAPSNRHKRLIPKQTTPAPTEQPSDNRRKKRNYKGSMWAAILDFEHSGEERIQIGQRKPMLKRDDQDDTFWEQTELKQQEQDNTELSNDRIRRQSENAQEVQVDDPYAGIHTDAGMVENPRAKRQDDSDASIKIDLPGVDADTREDERRFRRQNNEQQPDVNIKIDLPDVDVTKNNQGDANIDVDLPDVDVQHNGNNRLRQKRHHRCRRQSQSQNQSPVESPADMNSNTNIFVNRQSAAQNQDALHHRLRRQNEPDATIKIDLPDVDVETNKMRHRRDSDDVNDNNPRRREAQIQPGQGNPDLADDVAEELPGKKNDSSRHRRGLKDFFKPRRHGSSDSDSRSLEDLRPHIHIGDKRRVRRNELSLDLAEPENYEVNLPQRRHKRQETDRPDANVQIEPPRVDVNENGQGNPNIQGGQSDVGQDINRNIPRPKRGIDVPTKIPPTFPESETERVQDPIHRRMKRQAANPERLFPHSNTGKEETPEPPTPTPADCPCATTEAPQDRFKRAPTVRPTPLIMSHKRARRQMWSRLFPRVHWGNRFLTTEEPVEDGE